jgi:hypothetical protein
VELITKMSIGLEQPNIESSKADKVIWLAEEIFKAFPKSATGLVIYVLDCGCIYYQRKFVSGEIDRRFGIYRAAEDGPCEACMVVDEDWEERVVDETVVICRKIEIG